MNYIKNLWPDSLLFVKKNLNFLSKKQFKLLLNKLFFPDKNKIRDKNIMAILVVLNDAKNKDAHKFFQKIFLPWIYLKRKTHAKRLRILDEIKGIKKFRKYSEQDLIHAANIYRNIVSDIYDTYTTLLFASLKFLENQDVDIFHLDVLDGERQKIEFINSRINCDTLFIGYNPDVRNAISHVGSQGFDIEKDYIIFKSIRRGPIPKVTVIKWKHDELFSNCANLLEYIHSVDTSEEIFGLDNIDLIDDNFETLAAFINYALEDKKENQLISSQEKTLRKKQKIQNFPQLIEIFNDNCRARNMQISTKLEINKYLLEIDLNRNLILEKDNKNLMEIVLELPRYAILAKSIFGNLFEITKITDNLQDQIPITIITKSKILQDYIEKKASLLDICNNSIFFYDKKQFIIQFNKTNNDNYLGKPLPNL